MSIKVIAEMTGLSITTVSYAFSGKRKVSKKSMELINAAAAKINYRPNLAAQMMKTHRSYAVAIIIPETNNNNSATCFFFDVLAGAKTTMGKLGYELIVSTYSEKESQPCLDQITVLRRHWVDGVILVPPTMDYSSIAQIKECGVPVVLADRWVHNSSFPMVTSDNREVSAQAVRTLYQTGHRRIGFIGADFNESTTQERKAGYFQTMRELNCPVDPSMVSYVDEFNVEAGVNATRQLLQANVDAIFVSNSMLCLGTLKELHRQGISIPDQVAVIGFDNYEWTEIYNPPLTAISQNGFEIGRQAADLLIRQINGETVTPDLVKIPATLTLRNSHGEISQI